MTRIFLSAGEASGEQYAVQLMAALRDLLPAVMFFGLGGARMEAAGFTRIVRAEDVAVMGITEIVRHIPKIYREYRKLRRSLATEKPDVAVLIDFPDVNLGLARRCRQLGIPVIFFVSPQVWAWKQHRLPQIRANVDRMLVIFPFEEAWYRDRGVAATFVGHPLAQLPLPMISREDYAQEHKLDPAKHWIGLLPGSRPREIALNLPTMLAAARLLAAGGQPQPGTLSSGSFITEQDRTDAAGTPTPPHAGFAFLLPLAPTLTPAQVSEVRSLLASFSSQAEAGQHGAGPQAAKQGVRSRSGPKRSALQKMPGRVPGVPEVTLVADARAALRHARGSVVASGTATVEAALIGTPFVVVYRLSRASYAVARRVVKVPHVAMANLIAGRRVVPELIQDAFTPEAVVAALLPLIEPTPERAAMQLALADIRRSLQQEASAIQLVAENVLSVLSLSPQSNNLPMSLAL